MGRAAPRHVDPVDWLTGGALPREAATPQSYVPNTLHAKQREFLALECLEALYGGAAGGGKTEALLADALQYVDDPSYSALLLRRTFTALSLRGSIMQRAIEWLGRDFWNDRDKRFTFPSGATLQFGYCDSEGDLDRYKSAQFHRIYIDEITEWPEAWVTFLFSRIRRTRSSTTPTGMRSATNPDGIGAEWVRRRFGIPEATIPMAPIVTGRRVFLPARAEDNPSLDLEAYEQSLQEMSPAKYQQLRWGKWIRDGEGLVYSGFDELRNTGSVPACTRTILGIDYGVTNATAFVVLGWRDHDPTVYCLEAYKQTGMIAPDAAEETVLLEQKYGFHKIVGDVGGLGKGFVEEARRRFHVPIQPAQKNNKRGYIELLNGDLARGHVKIDTARCEPLRKEWLELPWAENRQDEAKGFENHCADAFLYAWRAANAFVQKPLAPPISGVEQWRQEALRMKLDRLQSAERDASQPWWKKRDRRRR